MGWIDAVLAGARENLYVETLLGRRRPMPDINSKNPGARVAAENAAVNTPVQGSAADIIKKAMLALDAKLEASPLQAQLLLQVHEELVREVPNMELEETIEQITEEKRILIRKSSENKVDFALIRKI